MRVKFLNKVSIITPTKNSGRYVESCIQSVLRQVNHEHLFIDGGSTDRTLSIIKDYEIAYPDKIKLYTGKDKNAGEAWVKGMRLSKGDILSFLGADDTLTPFALAHVLDYFRVNPDAIFVFGGCNYIDGEGTIIKTIHPKDFNLNRAVNDYCPIPATSAFYRRQVIETVNPDVIAENDGELEWWLRIAQKYMIDRIDKVLSNFRIYSDKARKDGFYEYANTVYQINKKYGMSPLSKCALRYYLAVMAKPLEPLTSPIFEKLMRK